MRFITSFACLWNVALAASSLSQITTDGNKFYTKDGTQFFIKGVAYQLSPDDPLLDGDQCSRDAELMSTLGVNTIRVYHVDPKSSHDDCMAAFAKAGIYTLIDLDTFDTYILSPTMSGPSWTQTQYDRYAAVQDAFLSYDNVLGFFIGNEVIAEADQSLAAPFIKAAVRDMKAYQKSKGGRAIPIGYSAADIAELRPMLQDYLTCGGKPDENIDFFSLNSYEWCDPSSYKTSGYENLEDQAKNFPVPIFFSETGCNTPGPRLFADQAAIFGPDMVNDWSGSIIYEWIQEANNYGLISYGSSADDSATSGTPVPISPDFANLKSQWATLSPTGVPRSANTGAVSTRSCPASTAGGWLVDGNVPLPTLGASLSAVGASTTSGSATATETASPEAGGTKGSTHGTTAGTTGGKTTGTTAGSTAGSTPGSPSAAASGGSGSTPSSASSLAPNGLGIFGRKFTAAGAALIGVTLVFAVWL
ncbi:Glycolipid anchored surface protein GAS1 [Niveomyces insectorum RCEF 264]|uniref:1,3-beta-glucanosyltransferase n=1 Tax=Niveomyces insectorum RCEF 264 TaxID=1081102 RepID=A0A167Z7R7_9HYPO|nr:Glycolipid anchored surface protein GAS1 [Niveomyces insectorum RCEF 264]